MAKNNRIDDEEFEHSACIEAEVAFYYPETVTPEHPLFKRFMIELQIAMLRCHLPIMFASDKKRAQKTLAELKRQLRSL